jgi:hypothetical protein
MPFGCSFVARNDMIGLNSDDVYSTPAGFAFSLQRPRAQNSPLPQKDTSQSAEHAGYAGNSCRPSWRNFVVVLQNLEAVLQNLR